MAPRRTRTWRVLYAVTLALMLCATSSQPILAVISYYPRYLALAVLAVFTYQAHRAPAMTAKQLPLPARLLTQGLALGAMVGACSTLWSVDPILTGLQAVALAALACTVHALISRRWVDQTLIPGDIGVAFWVLAAFFAIGIGAHLAGIPGTESAAGSDGINLIGLRFRGMADNPNMLAVLAVPAIPLGWHLFQQERHFRYMVGMLPAVASVLMSQSRTAMLAVGGAAAIMVVRRGVTQVVKVLVGGGVAWGLLYLTGAIQAISSSPLVAEISGRFASTDGGGALNGRSQAWSETAGLIVERPAVGYGYGAGPSLFVQLRATGDLAFTRNVVHNSYLQWILETGVIGLPALGFIVAGCVLAIWNGGRLAKSAGLAWCLLAGMIMQFTESAMLGTGQAYPSVFWIAAAAAATAATNPISVSKAVTMGVAAPAR